METFWLTVLGIFAMLCIFLFGLGLGHYSRRNDVEDWVDENCCYLCKEKLNYEQEEEFS